MATDNNCTGLKQLDPVQGLVDYVNDVKPYHTKVVEVLVEYVYQENVDIVIADELELDIHIFKPDEQPVTFGCNRGGYSTMPFGSPIGGWPIIPPNPGIDDVDYDTYPAIDLVANSVTIPGDRLREFPPGTSVQIVGWVDDSPVFVGGCGSNSLTFTVSQTQFNAGSIHSWEGEANPLRDPTTYRVGADPHTIITLIEPIPSNIIPSLGPNQTFFAALRLCPLTIVGVLSYSNAVRHYDPITQEYSQTPDEGYFNRPIVGITQSTVDTGTGIAIPDTGKIVIDGTLESSNVFVGDELRVYGATGNNGLYTITSLLYDDINDQTIIGVQENLRSNIVDGTIRIDIPSNIFVLSGNHVGRFTQGYTFDVAGGSFVGSYLVLSSDFYDGFTRVRVAENIIESDMGNRILSITTNVFVRGDQTTRFPTGSNVNLVGTQSNDGQYSVVSSVYDAITNVTEIQLDQSLSVDTMGRIVPVQFGQIKEDTFGFGEHPPICEYTPETLVRVNFDENIIFDGIGLDFHDNVIVYNMENSGVPNGFTLPINTAISPTEPCIPRQTTPPANPERNDFWYNTATRTLNRYVHVGWVPAQTVFWLEADNVTFQPGILHYRTITHNVDTGWVVALATSPGYSDNQPAIPKTQLFHEETIAATGTFPSNADTTYTIGAAIPNQDSDLVQVRVNNVPVTFAVTSSTQITIQSDLVPGDMINVRVFNRDNFLQTEESATCVDAGSRIGGVPYTWDYETNAHVEPFDIVPHQVLHTRVVPLVDRYEIPGGDFVNRMTSANRLTMYELDSINEHQDRPISIGVNRTDHVTNTLFVLGDYSSYFPAQSSIGVQTSLGTIERFTVVSLTFDGTETAIVVQQNIIGSQSRAAAYHFGPERFPIYQIDNVSDSITIPGNFVDRFVPDTLVKVANSTADNTDIVWRVQSRTYDVVNGRTIVVVHEDISDIDPPGTSAVLMPAVLESYMAVIGAYYIQDGDEKTFMFPSGPVHPDVSIIGYIWVGPVRFDVGMAQRDLLNEVIDDRVEFDGLFTYDDPTAGRPNDQTVDSTIEERLDFGWGTVHRWEIVDTNAGSNMIMIANDVTTIIEVGDAARIVGSQNNDNEYEVVGVTYNITTSETEITLANPSLPVDPPPELLGYFELDQIDITDWYQYLIISADSTLNQFIVHGDATSDVMPGMQFRVFGTTNDDLYDVVGSPTYDPVANNTTIQVVSISNDENGGWIESHRDYGINLILEDSIGVEVVESADAFLILDSGSVIGSFDYKYFDVGAFDESVGTVLHLYGNSNL